MNYNAKDISNFFNEYQKHVTHIVVAHTNIHTYGLPEAAIDRKATEAKASLRHAMNCFTRLLYPHKPNLPFYKPYVFQPLRLVTMEGAKHTNDPSQTIHFNISFGNLPPQYSATHIEIFFRHAWVTNAGQKNDIYCEAISEVPCNSNKWAVYAVKEARQNKSKAWDTNGTWDAENCWIPHEALAAY